MAELVMKKRAGRQGEYGLFVDSPVFEDDFRHIKEGVEVKVVATTPRSLRQMKFAWALATKIADACDWLNTKEEAMDALLIEARHYRRLYDPRRKVAILRPKPTNFGAMDGTEYTSLLKRIVHVATTVIVPGLDESALKAEIEAMIIGEPEPCRTGLHNSSDKEAGATGNERHRNPRRPRAAKSKENAHAS